MKLFLCSSFITKETQKDFEILAKKPMKGLRIACITTASRGYVKLCESSGEKADLSWLGGDINSAKEEFGCLVNTFDIEAMSTEEMLNNFSSYDAIWVEGGMTFTL
jgi:hypothetical protein